MSELRAAAERALEALEAIDMQTIGRGGDERVVNGIARAAWSKLAAAFAAEQPQDAMRAVLDRQRQRAGRWLAPPAAAPCPHIRGSGLTHWCALAEAPAAAPTDAMVEAAITAMDDVYSLHPAGHRPEITDQDRAAMRAAIDAALAREGR